MFLFANIIPQSKDNFRANEETLTRQKQTERELVNAAGVTPEVKLVFETHFDLVFIYFYQCIIHG